MKKVIRTGRTLRFNYSLGRDRQICTRNLIGFSFFLILLIGAALFLGCVEHERVNQTTQSESKENKIVIPELTAGFTQHRVQLTPGEVWKTSFAIYSKREGNAELKVYRAKSGVYETEELPKELSVSIEPSKLKVRSNEWCSFNVTVAISPEMEVPSGDGRIGRGYEIYFRLTFNDETREDELKIMVIPSPSMPVPGWSGLGLPRIAHPDSIKLKAGESAEVNCTLYTRETPPGIAKLEAYLVADVYNKEETPTPEGLSIAVEPLGFMVSPHEVYTWKIAIKTSQELPAGKYVLCLHHETVGIVGYSWLTVEVDR